MEPASSRPIHLHVTQINAASHLLGRAFQDDPLMVYLVPNASKRRRLLPAFFRVVTRYCLRYGTIYTTPGLDALACCLSPDQSMSIGRLVLAGLSFPPMQLGLTGLRRFLHVSRYIDEAHKRATPGAHWYVWVLGVEPERQSHGFGGQLLQTVLQQARAEHLPCYLDTQKPRNVPFYLKHGFRQVSEATIAGSDVHVYAMLWEPDEASLLQGNRI